MAEELQYDELEVYQASIRFVELIEPLLTDLPSSRQAVKNLDQSSTLISSCIAKGSYRPAERSEQFQQAIEAALDCSSSLDVLAAQDRIGTDTQSTGKELLEEVISGLSGEVSELSTNQSGKQDNTGYQVGGNSANPTV